MYIPTPLVSPGYGMYNTCDRAAPFGSRVKKRDRLGLYCLTLAQLRCRPRQPALRQRHKMPPTRILPSLRCQTHQLALRHPMSRSLRSLPTRTPATATRLCQIPTRRELLTPTPAWPGSPRRLLPNPGLAAEAGVADADADADADAGWRIPTVQPHRLRKTPSRTTPTSIEKALPRNAESPRQKTACALA